QCSRQWHRACCCHDTWYGAVGDRLEAQPRSHVSTEPPLTADARPETAAASPRLLRWARLRGAWARLARGRKLGALGIALALVTTLLVVPRIPPRVETVMLEQRAVVETLVTTGRVRAAVRVQIGTPIV